MSKTTRTAAIILTLAGIITFDAAFGTYDHPTHTTQPDITIATCGTAHVPAFTRTDVCIDASGALVRTSPRYTVRDGIARTLVTLF